MKREIVEIDGVLAVVLVDDLAKGGPGSGRYPAGSSGNSGGGGGGGGASKLTPITWNPATYSEAKAIVNERMSQLSPDDKEDVKSSAADIYYRGANQSANYKNIGRKLKIKEPDIDVVTSILKVPEMRDSDWRERSQ